MIRHSKTYVAAPPGFTIKEMADDRGITEAQLALSLEASESFVRDLIEGNTELTQETACKLAAVFGMRAGFWTDMERLYREDLTKVAEENARNAAPAAGTLQSASPVQVNFAV